MGVSNSPAELARKFAVLGSELADNKAALTETGMVGKEIFMFALRAKGVRGTTPISKHVKARFDVEGNEVTVRYTGSAHLLNNPTSLHAITPKGVRGSRASRGRSAIQAKFSRQDFGGFGPLSSKRGSNAIVVPGVGPRAYAIHPGTRGLKFFDDAKKVSYARLPGTYQRKGITAPLRKAFA